MSEQAPMPPAGARRRRRLLPILVILIAAGILVWRFTLARSKPPENIVALSGRIEGDDSAIAPKTGGRVAEIRFREGDSIKAGETIAILDDAQVRAREDQARAALLASEAR
jgi:HlyD family secretion protein